MLILMTPLRMTMPTITMTMRSFDDPFVVLLENSIPFDPLQFWFSEPFFDQVEEPSEGRDSDTVGLRIAGQEVPSQPNTVRESSKVD